MQPSLRLIFRRLLYVQISCLLLFVPAVGCGRLKSPRKIATQKSKESLISKFTSAGSSKKVEDFVEQYLLHCAKKDSVKGVLYTRNQGFICEIRISPKYLKLSVSDLADGQGVYDVSVLEGIAVRCKADDGALDLSPWTPMMPFADVFESFKVFIDQEGRTRFAGTFYTSDGQVLNSVTVLGEPVHAEEARILSESPQKLSPEGERARAYANRVVELGLHPENGVYFGSYVSVDSEYRLSNWDAAETPNEVFNWTKDSRMVNRFHLLEFRGKHRIDIEEYPLTQIDRINGILGQGKIEITLRAFSRSSSARIQASQATPPSFILKEPWSPWSEIEFYRWTIDYCFVQDAEPEFEWRINDWSSGSVSYDGTRLSPLTLWELSPEYLPNALKSLDYKAMNLPPEDVSNWVKSVTIRKE